MPLKTEIKSKFTLEEVIIKSCSALSQPDKYRTAHTDTLNAFLCLSIEIKVLKAEIKLLKSKTS